MPQLALVMDLHRAIGNLVVVDFLLIGLYLLVGKDFLFIPLLYQQLQIAFHWVVIML
tara:strand:- start:136 stop:306 length:171 start_codon:yes stop_codon:yes gene_type:complete